MSTRLTVENAQQLVDAFDMLGDWEERYRFIIDLGRKLAPLSPDEKVEANRVHGCQATVYMVIDSHPGGGLNVRAESDAHIVNGLIAILQQVYTGLHAAEAVRYDIESLLKQLDLEEHLSPTRRNGLYQMVKRIRSLAAAKASES